MFKSILRAAIRNIIRNKTFSLINLIGLSVSMSLCMLIIVIVKEQFTFDNFHKDSDRIYQVNATVLNGNGGVYDVASVPMPVAPTLKEYTIAEEIVAVHRFVTNDVTAGAATVALEGLFVDPAFLEVFNFPLEQGSPLRALQNSKSVVLTDEASEKMFGKQDPLGKIVKIGAYGEYVVTGVLQAFPGKTHFEFEALLPISALAALENTKSINPTSHNWADTYSSYVYVKLKEGSSLQAEQALGRISEKYGRGLKLDGGNTGYQFFLHPLDKITPGPSSTFNQMGPGIPSTVLMFLGALATVVLMMSIFNFTNLTIAKSLTRAREIAVRKIAGAKRRQVFLQFVGESIVFAFVALALSYILLQFLKTGMTSLWLSNDFAVGLEEDYVVYILFITFGIFVGVIAGALPASYLSALRPLSVMKDSGNMRIHTKFTLRKVLVVAQFTLSVIFVISVLVIYKQINFMVNADYGFNRDNVVNINLQGGNFEKLSSEIATLPGVKAVGGVSTVPGTWNSQSADYKKVRDDEPVNMRQLMVDDQYIDNLGLTFLAGKNFDKASESMNEQHVILNEQALSIFNLGTPQSAIGETILVNDTLLLEVTGVVKDFHYRPLSDQIGPLVIRHNIAALQIVSVWIDEAQKDKVMTSLTNTWKKIDPAHPISYTMMKDEMADAYRESGMQDMLMIAGYVTILAVTLACLGMLGMSLYAVQTRIKEVGIRMVVGATAVDVIVLLSKSFMKLIAIAVIIGVPISYIIGDQLLSTFAFHIEIGALLIIAGVSLIFSLGLLMVGSQALKAVLANPVRWLRYE
jgi:putative ABC transport system permease protein